MAARSSGLILVFFVYGLAFFIMGFAVALESRRSSGLTLAASLKYLAAFGLLHSMVEWMDMFLLILSENPQSTGPFSLRVVRTVFLALSTVLLVQFAVKLIVDTLKRHFWLRWMPALLFTGWLVSFVAPHLTVTEAASVPTSGVCLQCHRGQAMAYLAVSERWLTSADVWARYVLYFPGSLLAAIAIFQQRAFFHTMGLQTITRYCSWAAGAFGFNALVAGLIVPPAAHLPASVINYASFFSLVGIPPQIFRSLTALAIAFFIIRILSVFEIERARQLERAHIEQLEAQQQLLEAQRAAKEQLEEWSRELESRVQQRTREIEERDEQLVILEERDRIAAEIHDGLAQVMGSLSLRAVRLRQLLAGLEAQVAVQALAELERAIEEATADVREAILSLKTRLSPDVGLLPTLEEYLTKFGEQTGLKTETRLPDSIGTALTPVREVQLLRIVQEALTNVRKHARATRVTLVVEPLEDGVQLSLEDDGQGFDLAQVTQKKGHFGLQIMKERAEGVGAELSISTSPGRGTKVTVRLPQHSEEG